MVEEEHIVPGTRSSFGLVPMINLPVMERFTAVQRKAEWHNGEREMILSVSTAIQYVRPLLALDWSARRVITSCPFAIIAGTWPFAKPALNSSARTSPPRRVINTHAMHGSSYWPSVASVVHGVIGFHLTT